MTWSSAVWIAGAARSGTSWVGQIVNSHEEVRYRFQPLFSYEFKAAVDEDSTAEEYRNFADSLWKTETPFLIQADKVESGEYPRFRKSGGRVLAFKENRYQSVIEPMLRRLPEVRLIGVVRHPCAVIHSWSQGRSEFPEGADLRKEWRFGRCKNNGPEDYFGYYKWKELANLYLDLESRYPERVLLIHYEGAVRNVAGAAERIMQHLELPLTSQVREFTEQCSGRHSGSYYSVYKDGSQVERWRSELDPYIAAEITEDLKATRLERFLEGLG